MSPTRLVLEYVAIVSMIVASGIVVWQRLDLTRPSTIASGSIQLPARPVDLSTAHLRGNPAAGVGLLVFVDFECPFCNRFAYEVLPSVVTRYVDSNRIQLAVRHMPLDAIHPLALKAAYVAECAAESDVFWLAHDLLYSSKARLVLRPSAEIGRALGIRTPGFVSCVDNDSPRQTVDLDLSAAKRLGVNSVPTLFFGVVSARQLRVTRVLSGVPSFREVGQTLEQLLASHPTRS